MALFTWDNEFSVGHVTMDNHHKSIFDVINKLHQAMKDGLGEQAIGPIIDELYSVTKFHFDEEEKLMEAAHYSGIGVQKQAHKIFLDSILDAKAKAEAGQGIFAANEVATGSVKWLKDHILVLDKKYESVLGSKAA